MHNLKVNLAKSAFLQRSVTYLGHIVDGEGLHPSPEKVMAIREAPAPKNVGELRSWLGLVGYYGKFVPQLSEKLKPLNLLLRRTRSGHGQETARKRFRKPKTLCQEDEYWLTMIRNKQRR